MNMPIELTTRSVGRLHPGSDIYTMAEPKLKQIVNWRLGCLFSYHLLKLSKWASISLGTVTRNYL